MDDADDSGGVRSEPLELREGLCEWREKDVEAAEDDAARQCVEAGGGPTPTPAIGFEGDGAPPDWERPRSERDADDGSGSDLKSDSSGGEGGWLRRDEHEDHEPWLRLCEPAEGLGGNGNSPAPPPRELEPERRNPTEECIHGWSSAASDSMRFPAATPRAQSSAPLGSTEVHGTRISVEKVSLSTLK